MAIWTVIVGPYSLTGCSWAVDKSGFRCTAHQVIKKDGASATTKVGILVCNSTCGHDRVELNQPQSCYSRFKITLPVLKNPSCRQTTLASLVDHDSSQTVPHVSFQQTSTLPSYMSDPPTSLMSPFSQKTACKIKFAP